MSPLHSRQDGHHRSIPALACPVGGGRALPSCRPRGVTAVAGCPAWFPGGADREQPYVMCDLCLLRTHHGMCARGRDQSGLGLGIWSTDAQAELILVLGQQLPRGCTSLEGTWRGPGGLSWAVDTVGSRGPGLGDTAGSRGPGLRGPSEVQFSREAWRLRCPQVMNHHGECPVAIGIFRRFGLEKTASLGGCLRDAV